MKTISLNEIGAILNPYAMRNVLGGSGGDDNVCWQWCFYWNTSSGEPEYTEPFWGTCYDAKYHCGQKQEPHRLLCSR